MSTQPTPADRELAEKIVHRIAETGDTHRYDIVDVSQLIADHVAALSVERDEARLTCNEDISRHLEDRKLLLEIEDNLDAMDAADTNLQGRMSTPERVRYVIALYRAKVASEQMIIGHWNEREQELKTAHTALSAKSRECERLIEQNAELVERLSGSPKFEAHGRLMAYENTFLHGKLAEFKSAKETALSKLAAEVERSGKLREALNPLIELQDRIHPHTHSGHVAGEVSALDVRNALKAAALLPSSLGGRYGT